MADEIQSAGIYRPHNSLPVSRQKKQKKRKGSTGGEHPADDEKHQETPKPEAQGQPDDQHPRRDGDHLLDERV